MLIYELYPETLGTSPSTLSDCHKIFDPQAFPERGMEITDQLPAQAKQAQYKEITEPITEQSSES